jgi:hypothetical protein
MAFFDSIENLLENLLRGKSSSPDIFSDGIESLPASEEYLLSLNLSEETAPALPVASNAYNAEPRGAGTCQRAEFAAG